MSERRIDSGIGLRGRASTATLFAVLALAVLMAAACGGRPDETPIGLSVGQSFEASVDLDRIRLTAVQDGGRLPVSVGELADLVAVPARLRIQAPEALETELLYEALDVVGVVAQVVHPEPTPRLGEVLEQALALAVGHGLRGHRDHATREALPGRIRQVDCLARG